MTSIRTLARETLDRIANFIEATMSELEVEPGEEDVLIITQTGQHFLLNYHGVTYQIWYSSAMSGAHHFALADDGMWHCTRSETTLHEVLSEELSHLCQRTISIQNA